MEPQVANGIGWIAGACVLGFVITFIFSKLAKLSRNIFLIPYIVLISIFLYAFFTVNNIKIFELIVHNWIFGMIAAIIISIILVKNVRQQPASQNKKGIKFIWEIIWAGLIYGIIDGMFLSVMPVIAVSIAVSGSEWVSSIIGKIIIGIIGLLASIIVSISYHIGYIEFQGSRLKFAMIGPGLITLAYIIPNNPLGSIISHPVMHIAAVLQGPETTVQLPPHKNG